MNDPSKMPRDLTQLSLPELESLIKQLIGFEENEPKGVMGSNVGKSPTRAHVVTALAEVSRRLDASLDENEKTVLIELHAELSRWVVRDDRGLRKPRREPPSGGRGMCMCSTSREDGSESGSCDLEDGGVGTPASPK